MRPAVAAAVALLLLLATGCLGPPPAGPPASVWVGGALMTRAGAAPVQATQHRRPPCARATLASHAPHRDCQGGSSRSSGRSRSPAWVAGGAAPVMACGVLLFIAGLRRRIVAAKLLPPLCAIAPDGADRASEAADEKAWFDALAEGEAPGDEDELWQETTAVDDLPDWEWRRHRAAVAAAQKEPATSSPSVGAEDVPTGSAAVETIGAAAPAHRGRRVEGIDAWVNPLLRPQATVHARPSATARDFLELGVAYRLAQALRRAGFDRPTAVQSAAFRPIAQGNDVVVAAPSGTGKTLAYAVPLLQAMLTQPTMRVLVLQPTGELCQQLAAVLQQLLAALPPAPDRPLIHVAELSPRTTKTLEARPGQIVVATPTKLLAVTKGDLGELDTVVLDEADCLLSEYRSSVEKIFDAFREVSPAPRRWVAVAGTVPGIAAEAYENVHTLLLAKWPTATWVKAPGLHCVPPTLENRFLPVTKETRDEQLLALFQESAEVPNRRVLVFAVELADVKHAAKLLRETGVKASQFHNDIDPLVRADRLRRFNAGQLPVLVASPLGFRGLDFQGVTHVVHYTFPKNAVEFLHCVGRTARRGAPGWAATLYLPEEQELAESMDALIQAGSPLEPAFGRNRKFRVVWRPPLQARLQDGLRRRDKRKRKQLARRAKRLVREYGWRRAQPLIAAQKARVRGEVQEREKAAANDRWQTRQAEKQRDRGENERLRTAGKRQQAAQRWRWINEMRGPWDPPEAAAEELWGSGSGSPRGGRAAHWDDGWEGGGASADDAWPAGNLGRRRRLSSSW